MDCVVDMWALSLDKTNTEVISRPSHKVWCSDVNTECLFCHCVPRTGRVHKVSPHVQSSEYIFAIKRYRRHVNASVLVISPTNKPTHVQLRIQQALDDTPFHNNEDSNRHRRTPTVDLQKELASCGARTNAAILQALAVKYRKEECVPTIDDYKLKKGAKTWDIEQSIWRRRFSGAHSTDVLYESRRWQRHESHDTLRQAQVQQKRNEGCATKTTASYSRR